MMSLNASWSAEFPSSQTPGVYGRRNGTKRNEFYTSISTQQREPHSLSPFSFFILLTHTQTHTPKKIKKRMLKTILKKEWNGREDSAEIEIVDTIITLSAYTIRYRYHVVINYVWNHRDTITKQKHKTKSKSEWRDVYCVVCLHCGEERRKWFRFYSFRPRELPKPYVAERIISQRIELTRSRSQRKNERGNVYKNKVHCQDDSPNEANTFVNNSKELDIYPNEKKEHIVQNQVDFSVKLRTFIGIGNFFKGNLKPPAYSHVIQYVFLFSCMDMI